MNIFEKAIETADRLRREAEEEMWKEVKKEVKKEIEKEIDRRLAIEEELIGF